MMFRSWPAVLLLAVASCAGGRSARQYEEAMQFTDPGERELMEEIQTLPFTNVMWYFKISEQISRVTLGVDYLYIETTDNNVYAMDRIGGVVVWYFHVPTRLPLDWAPVEAYRVTEEIRREDEQRKMWARKVEDIIREKGPGRESEEAQKKRDQASERHRLASMGDNVYLISRGTMYCLVRTTGALAWSRKLTDEFVPSAQPFAVRTHVFVPSIDVSRVWALESGTGHTLGSFAASIGSHDKSITNQPKYEDPALYFVSHDGSVYSYHLMNNTLNWSFATDGELLADPVLYTYTEPVAGKDAKPARTTRFLFVGGMDHTFYALDAAGGNVIWKYETAGDIKTPAVAKDTTVYVKTEDGALFALELLPQLRDKKGVLLGPKRGGNLRWKLPLGERFLVKGMNFVYVMGPNNEIYRMNETTGDIAGRYPFHLFSQILTNTMDDIVYAAHPAGYIYALREPKE